MSSFEENEEKIAQIRAKALGQALSKAQADAETKEYFEKKVKPVQDKLVGTEKAIKTSEDGDTEKYYKDAVPAARKKLIGK